MPTMTNSGATQDQAKRCEEDVERAFGDHLRGRQRTAHEIEAGHPSDLRNASAGELVEHPFRAEVDRGRDAQERMDRSVDHGLVRPWHEDEDIVRLENAGRGERQREVLFEASRPAQHRSGNDMDAQQRGFVAPRKAVELVLIAEQEYAARRQLAAFGIAADAIGEQKTTEVEGGEPADEIGGERQLQRADQGPRGKRYYERTDDRHAPRQDGAPDLIFERQIFADCIFVAYRAHESEEHGD